MSILFVTPCYGGMMHAAHMRACCELKEELTKLGVKHDWLIGTNESLVHRGRMEMTATYLKTDYEWMMWLDADIEFTANDVATLWNMAHEIGAQICVGVYPMKKPGKSWYAAWHKGKLVKDLDQFDGQPIEVDFAGTGFMLISRMAIEKVCRYLRIKHDVAKALRKQLGDLTGIQAKVADEMVEAMAADFEGTEKKRVPALYMTPIFNDGLESEDYHLCRVARDAGLKIMMHPNVKLHHWGMYAYGQFEHLAFSAEDAAHQNAIGNGKLAANA